MQLGELQVGPAGDVEQHARRALDGYVQQRVGDRLLGGLFGAELAPAATDGHPRGPGVAHHGLHVGEVQVDLPGDRDQLGDRLHAQPKDVVGHLERVLGRDLLLADHVEALVGDHEQGVDLLLEALNALLGGPGPPQALECERRGDDADGQRVRLLDDAGEYRRRAGTRAAAHAGRDEDHVRVAHGVVQLVAALFGGARADLRIAPDTLAAGELVPDADPQRHVAVHQRLVVRVEHQVFDTRHPVPEHPGDRVRPSAPDSYDLDLRRSVRFPIVDDH